MKRLLTTLVALVALIGTAWCAPVTKGAKVDVTSLLLHNNAGITHQSDAGKPASRKNAPAVSPQSDPYITPVYSSVKAFPGDLIRVNVKTNVGDDVHSGMDSGLVKIDNPEIASLYGIYKWDDETYIYYFYAGSVVGETTIHISSPILSNAGLEATVSMEVTESFSPEDVAISFAPDTPETVVLGKPVDITVTYPEWLDGYGIEIWADDGDFDFDIIDSQVFAGRNVLTLSPKKEGEIFLGICPNIDYRRLDDSQYVGRTFNCEAPEFVHTAGETVNVMGISGSGEVISTLEKKSEGVYAGTVSLDGRTPFRISVPTDNGDVILGSCIMRYSTVEIQYGDRIVKANEGEEISWGRKYTLHDATDYVPAKPDSYFIVSGDSHGQAQLTVNLNTMEAKLTDPALEPYITVGMPELKALSEREFSVEVKSNIGDDLADGSLIRIDNPEVVSFDRIECQDDETFRYVFRSGNVDGETKIHISSPILEAAGLEATFIVTVTTTVNPEDIAISFAPDTPETVVYGTPVEISVSYPEGYLDYYDLWFFGDFDILNLQRGPGNSKFAIVPHRTGSLVFSISSELHDRIGVPWVQRTFECVASDLARMAGEEIYLKGHNNSGEFNLTLTKKSDGVYASTVDFDGNTAFRLTIPTENGEAVVGNYDSWDGLFFESNDKWLSVNPGNDRSFGKNYTLHDVTSKISGEPDRYYLGSQYEGPARLTVDLNTMSVKLVRSDFEPYITVEQAEIKTISEKEFSVIVKTNVGDDLYDGERNGMIRIDNPEVVSFDRIERQDDETFRYVFRSGNSDGETKIHITSPMLEENGLEGAFIVTVIATVNPEDIAISFAPETPETVVCGTPVEIKVTYPEGWLDDFDFWWNGEFNIINERRFTGERTYVIVPNTTGDVLLSVRSQLHDRLGIPSTEHMFKVVAPDFANIDGDEIHVKGRDREGDFDLVLTRMSDGLYTGTVDFKEITALRVFVPTADGEVILGNLNMDFGWWYNDDMSDNVEVNLGEDIFHGCRYQLHLVTDAIAVDPDKYYLGARLVGKTELTVDLNNMTATMMEADFKPYVTVEQTDINVRGYNDFEIVVKTNVEDDVYVDADEYVTVDNPELIGLNWIDRRDEETYVYHFNTRMESGSTTIHISSPILREAGLEAVVNVTVGDFRTESVTLSSSEVTVGMGKYAVVSYSAEPFDEVWLDIENGNEDVCALVVDNDRRVFVLGKGVGESEIIFRPNDNPDVTATLKVTVLPADAKVVEHIVYTELEPEQRTRLYLDEHQDGSEAAPAWSSSDESVATVDADGRVTALKAGRAVITADCGVHQVMAGIHVKNSTDVDEVAESRVNVYSQGTAVTVVGTEEGDTVSVYAADGSLMTSRRSDGSALRFDLGVRGAFVVTAGSESFKVVL